MTTANYNISIQYNKVELNLRFLFQLRTRAALTRLSTALETSVYNSTEYIECCLSGPSRNTGYKVQTVSVVFSTLHC